MKRNILTSSALWLLAAATAACAGETVPPPPSTIAVPQSMGLAASPDSARTMSPDSARTMSPDPARSAHSQPARRLIRGVAATRAVCRANLVQGPRVADRGIGGTGAPLVAAVSATPAPLRPGEAAAADTGVYGIITGFASICIDGLEISYEPGATVSIDGVSSSASALRAGQVAVIRASGPQGALRARSITVRSETAGRIEALDGGSGIWMVAGQTVSINPATRGAARFGKGDWVKVSGMRREDGVIEAARLDPARPGTLLVHGKLEGETGSWHAGRLALPDALVAGQAPGHPVSIAGRYQSGIPQPRTVTADRLYVGDDGYFDATFGRITVQGFVQVREGAVWLGGVKLPASGGVVSGPATGGLAIVTLERQPGGAVRAVDVRFTDRR